MKNIPLGKFDDVGLLASEDGKNAAAILAYKYTRTTLNPGVLLFLFLPDQPLFHEEIYHKYRLVNLVTGKTIIPKKESYLDSSIESIGNYFLIDSDLYQFLDNGEIQCVAKNNTALAVSILKGYFERQGITAPVENGYGSITIDYGSYIKEKCADPDLSGAFQEFSPEFDMPFEKAEPFYRDHEKLLNAPLAISERKYLLSFRDKETGKHAQGIYNESRVEWELSPLLIDEDSKEWYHVVEIRQTNNPRLYQIRLKNDNLGWDNNKYRMGIFNTDKYVFMRKQYLFDYHPSGEFLVPYYDNTIYNRHFPHRGVYYRDYSRIKD